MLKSFHEIINDKERKKKKFVSMIRGSKEVVLRVLKASWAVDKLREEDLKNSRQILMTNLHRKYTRRNLNQGRI